MILYTILTKSITEQKTFHYGGDLTHQELLPIPDILIIEEKTDGIFLNRYTLHGEEVGDTWHQSIQEAKQQALFEYGDSLDKWQDMPEDIKEPIEWVINHLKTN